MQRVAVRLYRKEKENGRGLSLHSIRSADQWDLVLT